MDKDTLKMPKLFFEDKDFNDNCTAYEGQSFKRSKSHEQRPGFEKSFAEKTENLKNQ